MTSMIVAADALIWMCQPMSLIALGERLHHFRRVAPAWARLNRMPRTPTACMRLSSSADTVSLTTATMRALGPNEASASKWRGCPCHRWRAAPARCGTCRCAAAARGSPPPSASGGRRWPLDRPGTCCCRCGDGNPSRSRAPSLRRLGAGGPLYALRLGRAGRPVSRPGATTDTMLSTSRRHHSVALGTPPYSLGRPSTRSPRMLRWISLVPAEIVYSSAPTRPLNSAAASAPARVGHRRSRRLHRAMTLAASPASTRRRCGPPGRGRCRPAARHIRAGQHGRQAADGPRPGAASQRLGSADDALRLRTRARQTRGQAAVRCPSLRAKRVSPLRHTCALNTLQATRDLRKVSLWLGHASTQTTDVYLQADPTEKLEALAIGGAGTTAAPWSARRSAQRVDRGTDRRGAARAVARPSIAWIRFATVDLARRERDSRRRRCGRWREYPLFAPIGWSQ